MKKNTFGRLVITGVVMLITWALTDPNAKPVTIPEDTVSERPVIRRPKPVEPVYKYDDAVVAISASDMFSSDKRSATTCVLFGQDSEYYGGIIGIAKSDMFSSDKRQAIMNLTKTRLETVDD